MMRVLVVVLVVQCSFIFIIFTVVIVKQLLVQPLQLCPETPPGLGSHHSIHTTWTFYIPSGLKQKGVASS